jgi:uncharacterized protein
MNQSAQLVCIYKSVIRCIMERFFEWDTTKALVFNDPLAVTEQDRIEGGEHRWQTIGMIGACMVLLVAHNLRLEEEDVEVVRIISARRVTQKERRRYEHG